jgi:tetratricopeptide (TPR) repeat protein
VCVAKESIAGFTYLCDEMNFFALWPAAQCPPDTKAWYKNSCGEALGEKAMRKTLRIPFTRFSISREYDDLFQRWKLVLESEDPRWSEHGIRAFHTSPNPRDHLSLAASWLDEGRSQEALEECQIALRLLASWTGEISTQTPALAYYLLGKAYLALGQLPQARAAWEQASTLDRYGIGDHARKHLIEHPVSGEPPPSTYIVMVVDRTGRLASRQEFHVYTEAADAFAGAIRRIRKERLYGVGFVERHPIGCIERLAIEPSRKRQESEQFRRVFFQEIKSSSSA